MYTPRQSILKKSENASEDSDCEMWVQIGDFKINIDTVTK